MKLDTFNKEIIVGAKYSVLKILNMIRDDTNYNKLHIEEDLFALLKYLDENDVKFTQLKKHQK